MENKKLSEILKSRGIKQIWVAQKLGVKKQQVSQWVRGETNIPSKYSNDLQYLLRESA